MIPNYFIDTCALIRSKLPESILEAIIMQACNTTRLINRTPPKDVKLEDSIYKPKENGYALQYRLASDQIGYIKKRKQYVTTAELAEELNYSHSTMKKILQHLRHLDPEFNTKKIKLPKNTTETP